MTGVKEARERSEDDPWFSPGPRPEPRETEVRDDWQRAEAGCAAGRARIAGRHGALDDRLRRGPEG